MTITLTPEIEKALLGEATRQGADPELLALDCLRARFLENGRRDEVSGTLADLLADSIGVLDSAEKVPGGANMSVNVGRKLAEGMEHKRKQGRL